MFIFTFQKPSKGDVCQVAAPTSEAAAALAGVFEKSQTYFKVSWALGYTQPPHFGLGHFDYWLGNDVSFSSSYSLSKESSR